MTAALPSGTVTFLFTDIEGSTQLLHQLGETYAQVLAEHQRSLRQTWAEHDRGLCRFGLARVQDVNAFAAESRAYVCSPHSQIRSLE